MRTASKLSPQNYQEKFDAPVRDALRRAAHIADNCRDEAAAVDFETGFPAETFRQIAATGLLDVSLPKELGGLDFGIKAGTNLPLLLMLKHIGRGNLAVGRVFEGHVNALMLIAFYGKPEQIKLFADNVRKNQKLFGVWNTEAADGVKITPLENGRYRLEGSKTFASGAGFVERPFVNCAFPDGGWQMCVVPMDAATTKTDESWWQPLGMRATRSFKIDFTRVELDQKYLIGAPGDYYKQPWFSGGAVRFAAVQLGGAEALFDLTRRYLHDLGRTNDPYQKTRLGEMAIRIESGNLWLEGAARVIDEYLENQTEENSARFLAYVNMMRTAIEQICQDVMLLCERSVGARGLMRPLAFERIIRDLTIYLRQPAPDAALAEAGRYVLESEQISHKLWRDEF